MIAAHEQPWSRRLANARAWLRYVAAPPGELPPQAFDALAQAFAADAAGDLDAAVAHLLAVPVADLVETARRHHCSGLVSRLLEAAPGREDAAPLRERFRRIRYASALQGAHVLRRASEVATRLREAGVEAVLLKGGARVYTGADDAFAHYSGDLDVLVPRERRDDAAQALLAAGYTYREKPARLAFRLRHMHDGALLHAPDGRVPVELHVALVEPFKVSAPLDWADLARFTRVVDGAGGPVRVLDDVGSALNLAYHGREFEILRDLVLLGRALATLTPDRRKTFDALVGRERRDRLRVAAAVAFAQFLGGGTASIAPPVARYLAWAVDREDLPTQLRRHSVLADSIMACNRLHVHAPYAIADRAPEFIGNLLLIPSIARTVRHARSSRGPALSGQLRRRLAPTA